MGGKKGEPPAGAKYCEREFLEAGALISVSYGMAASVFEISSIQRICSSGRLITIAGPRVSRLEKFFKVTKNFILSPFPFMLALNGTEVLRGGFVFCTAVFAARRRQVNLVRNAS